MDAANFIYGAGHEEASLLSSPSNGGTRGHLQIYHCFHLCRAAGSSSTAVNETPSVAARNRCVAGVFEKGRQCLCTLAVE